MGSFVVVPLRVGQFGGVLTMTMLRDRVLIERLRSAHVRRVAVRIRGTPIEGCITEWTRSYPNDRRSDDFVDTLTLVSTNRVCTFTTTDPTHLEPSETYDD